MNAAQFAVYSRREWRAPVFRFPAAHYDTRPEDLSYDGSNRVILGSDKSGNSAVNCLVLNGVAANNASFTALTAFGTGDFSVSTRVLIASIAATQNVFGGAINSFGYRVLATTGVLNTTLTGIVDNSNSSGAVVALQTAVLTYVRSGTTGTYYIDGVSAGTTTDSRNYSAGIALLGATITGSSGNFTGNMQWARVYSVALTAPQVVADAAGTIQANNTFAIDFSLYAKLAASPVIAATGQSVTINSTGATGARIAGARDLYQGLAANQPVLTLGADGRYYLLLDGSNDYLKAAAFALAQPETVYFVGSQVTWSNGATIYDGNVNLTGSTMLMRTGSPQVGITANNATFPTNLSTWATATNAIITAIFNTTASGIRYNRTSLTLTDGVGTGSANGFTLGARGGGSAPSNITVSEVLVYAAHDEIAQQRVARDEMRKRRIPMAA